MRKPQSTLASVGSALLLGGLLLTAPGCQKNPTDTPRPAAPAPEPQAGELSATQLDDYIRQALISQKASLDWNKVPEHVLWSGLRHSDQVLLVGYGAPGLSADQAQQAINQYSGSQGLWQDAKAEVLRIVQESEQAGSAAGSSPVVYEMNELGMVAVRVRNRATLTKLRASKYVRYAESSYEPAFGKQVAAPAPGAAARITSDGPGCGSRTTGDIELRENVDYDRISQNALRSWNYLYHNIPQVWPTGSSGGYTGKGIGVAILDTGLGLQQDNLNNTGFNNGAVTGRTVEARVSELWDSTNDDCGHGTALAGVIAAPRRGVGAMVGVAYGCDLYAYKAADDVVIDAAHEIQAVARAFRDAGDTPKIRIISMSMGRVGANSTIASAIKYAYEKGKLIFCASGTITFFSRASSAIPELNNLVFPANMTDYNGEVVQGVSGITTTYDRGPECVVGNRTDFVVVMARQDGGKPLGMARVGNIPTTIGGSSVATATMAGMAALVWSKNPAKTRAQVLSVLQQASDKHPSKHSLYGWGKLDASRAALLL